MVRFEDDRFTIEVETGCDPIEDWMGLHEEIVYLVSLIDQDNIPAGGLCHTSRLLCDMMPAWDTARKMVKS